MPKVLTDDRVTGLVDAGLGFRHGSPSMPTWKAGTGTPEGTVTAPVGSLYSRTDGSTNTAVYRKETGTGNTGWVATTTTTGVAPHAPTHYAGGSDPITGKLALSAVDRCVILGANAAPGTGGLTTVVGESALAVQTTGHSNTVVGQGALPGVTTGAGNVAVGLGAGTGLTTGSTNVLIGFNTSVGVGGANGCVVIGSGAQAVSNNIAIGPGVTAIHNSAVGIGGSTNANNDFCLGTTGHNVRIPGTLAVTGVIDATTGFRHGSALMPSWTKGTGSPENVVTAPIGSLYSRTDGGTDSAVYRKETGIGATGWVAAISPIAAPVASVDGRTGAVTLSDIYVNVTGDTMSGGLTATALASTGTSVANDWTSFRATNASVPFTTATGTAIVNNPVGRAFHDVLRFLDKGTPTEETLSGSTWTPRAITSSIFDGTESTQVSLFDGTTVTGARWTFGGASSLFGTDIAWVRFCLGYVVPVPDVTITLENSSDGLAWTTLVSTAMPGTHATNLWVRAGTLGQTLYARITIQGTNGRPVNLCALQGFGQSSTNQGKGVYTEYPYAWNFSKQIAVGGGSPGNGPLTIGANTTTSASALWFGTDTNLYRYAASGLRTDGVFHAIGAIAIGTNPATTGALRLPHAQAIAWRNSANTDNDVSIQGNSGIMYLDCTAAGGYMNVRSGPAYANALRTSATLTTIGGALVVDGAYVQIGANPAAFGALRLPNTTNIAWQNAANSGVAAVIITQADNNLWLDPKTGSQGYLSINGAAKVAWTLNSLWFNTGVNLDLGKNEAQNFVSHKLAAAPGSSVEGQRFYNTVIKAERFYDGTNWVTIADQTAVSTSAPTGTLNAGDLWYDTDETSATIPIPLTIANGGTSAGTVATARSNLSVPYVGNSTSTGGAPTSGTYVRGDHWLDSNNVLWVCTVAGTPGTWRSMNQGEELAYNQITASVAVSVTTPASPNLVIEGTSRSYDGSPIIVEVYSSCVQASATAQAALILNLWDSGTDLGYIAEVFNGSATGIAAVVSARRRIVPTVGTHNYRIVGIMSSGGAGTVFAGAANAQFSPAYVRVTRA